MTEQELHDGTQRQSHRSRRRIIILPAILFLLLASFLAIFLGFNYYGERLLRRYLQEKIILAGNGLYQADFKTLHVNILTGKVVLDSFQLIPDTLQYQRLKAEGRIARSLYRVSITTLTIDKVHFRQIFARKRINFRQMTVQQPRISIVGFPDTLTAKRSRWRVIYEDLYPAVSGFFNDFHIDSVKVNHGLLLTSFLKKSGSQNTGDYEFSALLKDVSVNPFSFYNRDRVFYSRDVNLVIHNFASQLADSLYSLKADEIGFSLTRSVLYGKKVTLTPNFKSKKIRQLQSGDLFRIDLPAFSIDGIDLYQALTSREVAVSTVSLSDFIVQVYRNHSKGAVTTKKSKKKMTVAELYTVVAKELRFISVDALFLKNGSFAFYGNLSDTRPELKIGTVNLELGQFRLDSLASLDPSRIFYSKSIEIGLERISLNLRDGIHCINASAIDFSTRKSLIDIREATIFPDRKKNLLQTLHRQNTLFVSLPRLTFAGIDLKKVFNRRILDFERLVICEPEVGYTRFRAPKNPDPRFKRPEDFFESENEDVVYDLLKKYLWVIRGDEIKITGGLLKYSTDQNGSEIPLATTSFDLTMQQFLIDSVHGMNEQGYFYSRDFDLDLRSVSVVSPDSLKHLKAGRVHIATADSLIEADDILIVKSAAPHQAMAYPNKRQSLTFEFSLGKISLTGLDHKKLFLEKILKANQIILDNPSLYLKTNNNLQPVGPPEQTNLLATNKIASTFEIGRCLVRNGALSYDGEEDRKASFFSLKEIEFEVVRAMVHVPGEGKHDGLIKFDSLQLKVVPLRAVIGGNAYAMEARSLEVHSYPADITLQGIQVTPMNPRSGVPQRTSVDTITIPEIQLKGFFFDRAIFDDQWILDEITVDHPSLKFGIWHDENSKAASVHIDPSGLIRVPPFMKVVDVGKVSVSNASAGFTLHNQGKKSSYRFTDMMLDIAGFRVDSATRANAAGTPLFNARDFSFSSPGFSLASSDSMYTYTIGRFGFSTGKATAFFDSVAVTPNFSRGDFARKLGYQTDRIVLKIPRTVLSHVDFRKLVSDRQLHVTMATMDGLSFESFRDKRLPFPDWQRPVMPAKMVAGIKFPLCIDTVTVSNGFATYEEQTGDEPGRIFFDRMNATLTGLCTFTPPVGSERNICLHGSARLMGIAPVESWFSFLPSHPRDTFNVHATIGELDLRDINPMLSKLLPASITRGTATAMEIFELNGNEAKAIGRMNFRYHDLAIRLHATRPGTWNRLENSLLTEVANLALSSSNPNSDGKMKNGIIYFERDSSKGFFNFVWKSVFSGIRSSFGFDSKIQKEIKKQQKKKNES